MHLLLRCRLILSPLHSPRTQVGENDPSSLWHSQIYRCIILASGILFFNTISRDHYVYARSQWERTLQCNVFHWPNAYIKWSLNKAWTQWPFCKRHFQMYFLQWSIWQFDWNFFKISSQELYDDKSLWSQVKPLHEQCWTRPMAPYDITGPQWVKESVIWFSLAMNNFFFCHFD